MKILAIIALIALSGCASEGYNGLCGRITTQDSTLPYVGGKGNIDGFACHLGHIGAGKPDYSALVQTMKDYSDSQSTSGKIMTTTPGIVTFTPSK